MKTNQLLLEEFEDIEQKISNKELGAKLRALREEALIRGEVAGLSWEAMDDFVRESRGESMSLIKNF